VEYICNDLNRTESGTWVFVSWGSLGLSLGLGLNLGLGGWDGMGRGRMSDLCVYFV